MAKEPKTKEDFLNKMLSIDFSGDLHDLAIDRNIHLKRLGANKLEITFPSSGNRFELVVRKPRSAEALAKLRAKRQAKGAPKPARASRSAAGAAKH